MRRGDLDSSDEIHLLKRGGPSAPRPAGPRPRDPRVCGQAELRQELTSEPRQLKAAHISLDGFARLVFFSFFAKYVFVSPLRGRSVPEPP